MLKSSTKSVKHAKSPNFKLFLEKFSYDFNSYFNMVKVTALHFDYYILVFIQTRENAKLNIVNVLYHAT